MKKFTKSLIALALLFAGTMGANAERVYADLSKFGERWDATNGVLTFSWTARWGNQLQPELNVAAGANAFKGDLTSWEKLVVEVSEINVATFFRILVYNTNEKDGNGQDYSNTLTIKNGRNEIILANAGIRDLSDIKRMVISGSNDGEMSETNPASFKVTAIYLERPDVVQMSEKTVLKAPTGSKDLNGMTGDGTIKWDVSYPKQMGPQDPWLGSIDNDNQSVNISDYDYLYFIVSDVEAGKKLSLRVFVSEEAMGNNDKRHCLYPYPINDATSVDNWESVYYISTPGVYVVKISDYPLLRGFKSGNGFNGDESNGKITISQVYLTAGNNIVAPVSESIISGEEALSDATVTCFDVTALSSSGISFNAANPNALFIAKEGQLTNTKNVIVNGVCANLELTDQKPFQAPAAFTATSAKFTKTVGDAGYGTMMIPFDASVPEGVEAYDITSSTGDVLTTTQQRSVTANKPVMLKNAGTFEFTASNAAVAATPADAQVNGLLKGVYADTAVPTENTYVLQKQGTDVNFYKAVSGMTINPFRAYLTTSSGAARLTFDFDEVTGIKTIETTGNAKVYNLQGVRVDNPTKGLYIVNGKKVIK